MLTLVAFVTTSGHICYVSLDDVSSLIDDTVIEEEETVACTIFCKSGPIYHVDVSAVDAAQRLMQMPENEVMPVEGESVEQSVDGIAEFDPLDGPPRSGQEDHDEPSE